MTPSAPISVGIDGSESALAAARWAASYGRAIGSPLRIVHSIPNLQWYLSSVAYVAETSLVEEMTQLGEQHLDAAADAIHVIDPFAEVHRVNTEVPIADYLARSRSSLVILGPARRGPVRDIVLGSSTIRIINTTHSPVMIRRGDEADLTADQPVVVGFDGSNSADEALLTALTYARTVRAPVTVAHYWGDAMNVGLGAGYLDWDKVGHEERRWLCYRIDPVCSRFADVQVRVVSSNESPSAALRSLSMSARLVVVGSAGQSKVAGAILGSVSQNVVHHGYCSVLVVR